MGIGELFLEKIVGQITVDRVVVDEICESVGVVVCELFEQEIFVFYLGYGFEELLLHCRNALSMAAMWTTINYGSTIIEPQYHGLLGQGYCNTRTTRRESGGANAHA